MIMWNCGHEANKVLVPEFLAQKDGAFLHRFEWLEDSLVGEVEADWNWLAEEYPTNDQAKIIHYTLGTPCFKDYKNSDMSEYWHDVYERVNHGFD